MTAPAPISRLAAAALRYAEQGWFVFPLQPRSKEPLPRSQGFKDATTNQVQVARVWVEHPDANIGLWPRPSGLLVIDVDGPAGEQTAQTLGLLAEPTLEVVSGRDDGGRHRYYRHPGFLVGNVAIGEKLDVRANGGYVLLPPSVHPSGRTYTWRGKASEIADLPPGVLEILRGLADPDVDTGRPPALSGEDVGEGGRNNMLTRAAGNLLAKHPLAEATELLQAWNVAHCRPPLAASEVAAIMASLAKRESRKASRTTSGGTVLAVSEGEAPPEPEPWELSRTQVAAACERGRVDLSDAPRWQWTDLHSLVGPMIPGDLVVVGALSGNGKTSLLLSQLDWMAAAHLPTLYLPLEVDPSDVRRRWAAWKLGYDYKLVARNVWPELPDGAQVAHERMLEEQGGNPYVQFPPDKRVTLAKLAQWVRWGVEKIGAKVIIVDHFHRMDFGGVGINYRVQVTEAVRAVKDLARAERVAVIAAAQLNQDGDQLDRYFPPSLRRLKESAGIGEEADCVLMLSRRLREILDAEQMKLIRAGHRSEREYEQPNTMTITCRKHRLDDAARDRGALLHVEAGRVLDRAPLWRQPSRYEP